LRERDKKGRKVVNVTEMGRGARKSKKQGEVGKFDG